jgi:predicted acylesterase/phospholipase RssA
MSYEYLVIGGGGLKYGAQVGAIAALELAGLLPGIKTIAGCSLGAITSALLAAGCNTKELHTIMSSFNLSKLMGKRTPYKPFQQSGEPIYALVNNEIKKKILSFFDLYISSLKYLAPQDKIFISNLLSRCRLPSGTVHFSDLTKLNKLYPRTFKKLVVTVIDSKGNPKELADYTRLSDHIFANLGLDASARDLDIAHACRASVSLPVLLKPIKIGKEFYYDGGIYNNVPYDAIFNVEALGYQQTCACSYNVHSLLNQQRRQNYDKSLILYFPPYDAKPVFGTAPKQVEARQYNPSLIEKCIKNKAPSLLSRLRLPYKNTDRIKINEANLRRLFKPEQIIGLEVTEIFYMDHRRANNSISKLFNEGFHQCARHLHNNFSDIHISCIPYVQTYKSVV